MAVIHIKVTFVNRQISGLTNCPTTMMQIRRHISELYEITKIFDIGVTAPARRIRSCTPIGPGGHYLGDSFTLKHFQTAFTTPEILDYEAWEHWEMNGSLDIQTRARAKAEKLPKEYEAPEIDIAVKEALDSFVEKRQEEISPGLA